MKDPDPLEPILGELAELIEFMQKNASKPMQEIPKSVERRLEELEGAVRQFKEATEKGLAEAGESRSKAVDRVMHKLDQYPVEQKKLINQSLKLGEDLIVLKVAHEKALKKIKKSESKILDKTPPTKKTQVKRKSKFKKMGGDKSWNKI